jgi:hypothetical protein
MLELYLGFVRHGSVPGILNLERKRYEYLMPFYSLMKLASSLPNWLLTGVAWFLSKFTSEQRLPLRLRAIRTKDHEGVNELYQRHDQWRVRFDDSWRAAGIDALLTPC